MTARHWVSATEADAHNHRLDCGYSRSLYETLSSSMPPGEQIAPIAAIPAEPRDILQEDQGVRLRFDVAPAPGSAEFLFTLRLTTESRPVRREVEHRFTDVLPFLFALDIDGKPVGAVPDSFSKAGGNISRVDLVPPNGQRVWSLRVADRDIRYFMSDSKPHRLRITAAFSERQHQPFFRSLLAFEQLPLKLTIAPRPVLVRSNTVTLLWNGSRWELEK